MERLRILVIDDHILPSGFLETELLELVSVKSYSSKKSKHQICSWEDFLFFISSIRPEQYPDIVLVDRDFSKDVTSPQIVHQDSGSDSRGLFYASLFYTMMSFSGSSIPLSVQIYSGNIENLLDDGYGMTFYGIIKAGQDKLPDSEELKEKGYDLIDWLSESVYGDEIVKGGSAKQAWKSGLEKYRKNIVKLIDSDRIHIKDASKLASDIQKHESVLSFMESDTGIRMITSDNTRTLSMSSLFADFLDDNERSWLDTKESVLSWFNQITKYNITDGDYALAYAMIMGPSETYYGRDDEVKIPYGEGSRILGIAICFYAVEIWAQRREYQIKGTGYNGEVTAMSINRFFNKKEPQTNRAIKKILGDNSFTLTDFLLFLDRSNKWSFGISVLVATKRYLREAGIEERYWPQSIVRYV